MPNKLFLLVINKLSVNFFSEGPNGINDNCMTVTKDHSLFVYILLLLLNDDDIAPFDSQRVTTRVVVCCLYSSSTANCPIEAADCVEK